MIELILNQYAANFDLCKLMLFFVGDLCLKAELLTMEAQNERHLERLGRRSECARCEPVAISQHPESR